MFCALAEWIYVRPGLVARPSRGHSPRIARRRAAAGAPSNPGRGGAGAEARGRGPAPRPDPGRDRAPRGGGAGQARSSGLGQVPSDGTRSRSCLLNPADLAADLAADLNVRTKAGPRAGRAPARRPGSTVIADRLVAPGSGSRRLAPRARSARPNRRRPGRPGARDEGIGGSLSKEAAKPLRMACRIHILRADFAGPGPH